MEEEKEDNYEDEDYKEEAKEKKFQMKLVRKV